MTRPLSITIVALAAASLALALAGLASPSTALAQGDPASTEAVVPPPPLASSGPAPAATALTSEEDPRLQLEDVDRRSAIATALYVSSTVLVLTSGGGVFLGGLLLVAGAPGAGLALLGASLVTAVGHVVTMTLAICFDVGSAHRRDALRRAHPDLRARLTGGPGDAGLAFALEF